MSVTEFDGGVFMEDSPGSSTVDVGTTSGLDTPDAAGPNQ